MQKYFFLWCFILLYSISTKVHSQENMVIGKVTAFNNYPIVKAHITNKKSKNTVQSDSSGIFKIKATIKDKLIITANAFHHQKTTISTYSDTIHINLTFKGGEKNIEIATGYGHIQKEQLSYGITHYSNENEASVFYANIYDMLKSKYPGVTVSGESVRIRGVNNMNGDTTPLFVIDGFPVGNQIFKDIDPQEVNSISILKDGAASARYGTRGMNGVIIVVMKRKEASSANSPL